MRTFVNILILLALTITMISIIDENTYEPFSGMLGNLKQHYNKQKRNIRTTVTETHNSIYNNLKRRLRKSGL